MRTRTGRPVVVALAVALLVVVGAVPAHGVQGPPPGSPEGAVETAGGLTLRWTTDATTRNGPAPSSDPVTACGSDQYTYLTELLEHPVPEYEVPQHWGDVVVGGQQVMVSGTVQHAGFGTGDLPFDHVFGSDFNMDVGVDPQFAEFTQMDGGPTELPMHVELEEGLFPHARTTPGSASGATWNEMSDSARENVQPGYLPLPGDRVIVMGRWILDCGHGDYFTELHPLTFMAWSHVDGDRTTVGFFYNPYRVAQRYHPDPALATQVDQPTSRGGIFNVDAIQYLVSSINRLQDRGQAPYCCQPNLDVRVLLEALRTRPSPFKVCAPEGTSGAHLRLRYDLVTRPGVRVTTTRQPANGCVKVDLRLGSSTTRTPVQRTCTDPWDFLETAAGEEAGSGPIDIRDQLKSYISSQYDARVDVDPTQSCYDPLSGPLVQDAPTGWRIRTRDVSHPMYGRIAVYWEG